MAGIVEQDWKSALTSIIEELDEPQYNKMRERLVKIPRSQRTEATKEKMPQLIIEHYGVLESISVISDTMEKIPRRDPTMQELLQPFVQQLQQLNSNHEKGNKGRKRKRGSDPEKEKRRQAAGKKRKRGSDSAKGGKRCTAGKKRNTGSDAVKGTKRRAAAGPKKSCPTDKRRNTHSWKKTILDLQSSSELLETDAVVGNVVQKFGLQTYQTQHNVKKTHFYLVIADETACIKMTVYGKNYYKEIMEGRYYLFRKMMKDGNGVTINTLSKVSETSAVDVPEKILIQAQNLVCPERRVCSIAEVKASDSKTEVSVEGTITEIDSVKTIKRSKGKNTKRQDFHLKDDTGFIRICMWAGNTEQCKEISIGDVVKVLNVKINHYFNIISLNSTGFTRILKVQSTGVQNVRIEIIGIIKANKSNAHLEVDLHDQLHTKNPPQNIYSLYNQVGINCFIAAAVYVVVGAISLCQVRLNKRQEYMVT
ncbi:hypothetical protein Q5P01_018988 [Channa striata]|uniref:Replication protein A OB domain-containing protein n=1 Tax=Channa striata TaxID=64152 RepID=A0AA88SD95_CHASR|nr:hypothetical protein Q5P01_018988 [Channa striata]